MLQHAQLFATWNNQSGNVFKGIVDTQQISLCGHSRGGGGVSASGWLYDKQNYKVGNKTIPLGPFNFALKSLIYMAPCMFFCLISNYQMIKSMAIPMLNHLAFQQFQMFIHCCCKVQMMVT